MKQNNRINDGRNKCMIVSQEKKKTLQHDQQIV